MLLLAILSWWVCFSPSTMALFRRQCCWFFFWVLGGFPHCPWVWPLTQIAAYIRTTLLSDRIVAICPPSEACLCTRHLQWWRRHRWQLILQQHRTSIPSSYLWLLTRQNLSRIIIWRCRFDSSRRWEHLAGFGKVSKVVSCCIFAGSIIHQGIYAMFTLRTK